MCPRSIAKETQRWDYNMGVLTLGMYTLPCLLYFTLTIKGTSKNCNEYMCYWKLRNTFISDLRISALLYNVCLNVFLLFRNKWHDQLTPHFLKWK